MAKIRSVKFNVLMNTMLTASNMLVSLVTIPYVTRVLGVACLGDVSFAQSVSTWMSALCLVGINVYGVRECAKVRDNERELARVVRELLVIITCTTAIVLTCFAFAIFFVPSFSAIAPLMWMFLVGTLLLSYGVEWFYQGIEQYSYITVRSVIFKVAALVATLLFVRQPDDYLLYGGILALVTCGNNLLNLIRLNRMVDFRSVQQVDVRRHFRPLAAFGVQSIAQAVYLSFDSTLLGVLVAGNYQVGLYQLATKIKAVLFQVLYAVLGVFIPRLSNHLAHENSASFNALLRKGFGITINVGVAIACYLLLFSELVVLLISGEAFLEAVPSVRIIGVINLLSCMSYYFGLCILTPLGRERELAMANMIGVPISVVLNVLLDPLLGAVGAALSLLVAEAVILCIQGWWVRDILARVVRFADVGRVIASNGIAVVCSMIFVFSLQALGVTSVAVIAFSSFVVYSLVDILVALALGDEAALMLKDTIKGVVGRV